MIVSRIYGGLGNQFFQYARGKALSRKLNCPFFLDISFFKSGEYIHDFLLDKFSVEFDGVYEPSLIENLKIKLNKKRILRLHNILSEDKKNNEIIKRNKKIFLDGYWQNEKYFISIKEYLHRNLKLKNSSEKLVDYINQIRKVNSISVHLRRGDYLSEEVANHIGVCDIRYYIRAIEKISLKNQDALFYIFSDDISWCIENLKINKRLIFVGNEFKPEEAFELMRNCDHNIISNSTFSWWAAWLNPNPNKTIIAPKTWWISDPLKTPVPTKWVKLEN